MTQKETSIFCFTTAANAFSPGTPMSKVVMMTITALCNYGIHCINAWEEINSCLKIAQYNYEMAEWYGEVLIRG